MSNFIPEHRRLPFDTEKAKRGEPVCTAEGEAIPIRYDRSDPRYSFVRKGYDRYSIWCWTEDGHYHIDGRSHPRDLRMIMPEVPKAAIEEALPVPTRIDPATLEPFDRARAEAGEKVYTDLGWPVFGLQFDLRGNPLDMAGIIRMETGDILRWLHPSNLRMAPKPQRPTKRWYLVSGRKYSGDGRWCMPELFETAGAARRAAGVDPDDISFTDIPE